jgi:hypothetical protein
MTRSDHRQDWSRVAQPGASSRCVEGDSGDHRHRPDGADEDTRDWEEMLQGGLQTALESQVIVFEVSRRLAS